MNEKCWIPEIIPLESYDGNWQKYEDAIYCIFKNDFITSTPQFNGKKVQIKKYPIENEKENAFFHVTCADFNKNNERLPDMRRCERIRWIRAFIENYNCDNSKCTDCNGVKIWQEPYKSRTRIHILLEEERYLVILEDRKTYYLLITAYYLDYDHSLEKQLNNYEKYKKSA